MHELRVSLGERSYPIFISSKDWQKADFTPFIGKSRVVVVSNTIVADLYLSALLQNLPENTLSVIIADGESEKTLQSFEYICGSMLGHNLGRDTVIVALGGGVIGDLAGFVAACYQRGIPFIQIPTTLLAQVDSSVGGKTAVNHALGKNMIGAFYQPQAVFINLNTLSTLPKREFSAGFAEVVKYGLIFDWSFFEYLEQHQTQILARDNAVLANIIQRCCQFKADVVAADEKESGDRALLNLGHTFGHAIEAELGYGTWLHGEAVAAGMVMAAKLSERHFAFPEQATQRLISLLEAFNLPTTGPAQMSATDYIPHMRKDKKNQQGKIRLILPIGLGRCAITDALGEADIISLLSVR